MKKIIALALILLLVAPCLVFEASAAVVVPDTSWYSASQSEFVINTAAQLAGVSNLCAGGTTFAGKTLKLGADIVYNPGDMRDPSATHENSWTPIYGFAGTFDGQGHTIYGLYSESSTYVAFIATGRGCTIKNLSIMDSYFCAANSNASAFIAAGNSTDTITITRCRTNAKIISETYNGGGFVATVGSALVTNVSECIFEGSIEIGARYAGGIIANGEGKTLNVSRCLNAGSIYTSQAESSLSHLGGIVGRNDGSTTITGCLNVGLVDSASCNINGMDEIGSIMGACASNAKTEDDTAWTARIDVSNSWASSESCARIIGGNSSKDPTQRKDYHILSDGLLVGYNAYYNTTLDFASDWTVVVGSYPVPKYFAASTPALYGTLNVPSITGFDVRTTGYCGPRWTVTLNIPSGFTASDVSIGLVVVPTKVIPENFTLFRYDGTLEYRGHNYPVADIPGTVLRSSSSNTVVASFVVTELSAQNIRSNLTVRPYVIYHVSDGDLELYGNTSSATFYTEAKLVTNATDRARLDALLAPIDAEIGEGFTVSRSWSTRDIFEDIPALVQSGATILPEEDHGLGNYVIEVDNTVGMYGSYVSLLEKNGFTKVVDNGEEGLFGATYVTNLTKDDLLVTVTDVANQNKMFVSAMYDQPLSPHLFDNYRDTAVEGAVNTLHQIDLYYWGDSYVIQLKNGHLIIVDGATDYELGYLLDYIETLVPTGEKPVIEAWCNTHLHYDHFHLLSQFSKNPDWCDRVYVEGFYFSEPSNAVKDVDPGVYGQINAQRNAIAKLRTTEGVAPEIYRPQTGQRYYFCDITMDIMLSQEQIPFATYEGGFNESSTWYLFTMDGQTFLEGGDGHHADMKFIMASYTPADLQVDFFSVLHHGYNTWDDYTNWVGVFKTILFPTQAVEKAGILNQAKHKNLVAHGVEYFFAGEGTDVFYLPYTPGKTGTDGGHVKLIGLHPHKSDEEE